MTSGLVALQAIRDGSGEQIPLGKLLGFRLIEAEAGRVAFSLEPTAAMLNSGGVLHGGVLSLVLDQAVGDALRTLLPDGTPYMTLDLFVTYVRSGTLGSTMRCEAEVTSIGRRTSRVSGRVFAQGKVLCECMASLFIERETPVPLDGS